MTYYIKLYLAAPAVFFAVDLLWPGLISCTFYQKHLGFLLSPDKIWMA